jgi:hypothetical protein
METPKQRTTQVIVTQLHELREAFEGRLHRDTARVQQAFQQRCDQLYDEHYADLCLVHDPEEARRRALEAVRRFRRDCKPKLDEIKRIIWERKRLVDELMDILRDYSDVVHRLQPSR